MGTGKPGRYLNTHGSRITPSEYAVVHANEGTFTHRNEQGEIRLRGGGHGQDGMNLLDKYGIAYHVTKTYSNGVRIGNIPRHKDRTKARKNGQAWFPASWTESAIKSAGKYVARLKRNRGIADGVKIWGRYRGVKVGVIMTKGQIGTIFPSLEQ